MAVYVSLPVNLVVVVSNVFYFHPDPGGYDSHFDEHNFSSGLVQPPTSMAFFLHNWVVLRINVGLNIP